MYFAAHGVRYVSRYHELSVVLKEYDSLLVQRGLYALGPGTIAMLVGISTAASSTTSTTLFIPRHRQCLARGVGPDGSTGRSR